MKLGETKKVPPVEIDSSGEFREADGIKVPLDIARGDRIVEPEGSRVREEMKEATGE